MPFVIEVLDDGRWVTWDRAGGGDYVMFSDFESARSVALATRELAESDEDVRWRINEALDVPLRHDSMTAEQMEAFMADLADTGQWEILAKYLDDLRAEHGGVLPECIFAASKVRRGVEGVGE